MQVLEKGTPWTYKLKMKCTGKGNGDGGCGAKLLVEPGDIFHTCHTDMAGDTDYYFTIRCPECAVLTDIPDRSMPNRIRKTDLPHYQEWLKRQSD